MEPEPTTYGCWPSPVTAQMLTRPSLALAEIQADDAACWWSESRPGEGGRTQLVRRDEFGGRVDVLPEGYDARTLVHEYGGGAWTVDAGTVVFSNLVDQRIYRLDPGTAEPVVISPAPESEKGLRYGDLHVVSGPGWAGSRWVLAVRESHEPMALERNGEPVNEIVAVPLDGSAADDASDVVVLVTGPDFVSSARTHDGRLAWVQWEHPNMPFDNTSLLVADLVDDDTPRLGQPRLVAGDGESVMQPRWSSEGDLWFLSDRNNWWNLYRRDGEGTTHVAPVDAELGHPAWGLNNTTYDFLPDGRIVSVLVEQGHSGLVVLDPGRPTESPQPIDCGLTAVQKVAALPSGQVLTVAGAPSFPLSTAIVTLDGDVEVVSRDEGIDLGPEWWSAGRPTEYPSGDGRTAHAVVYLPRNPEVTPRPDTRPPLVVMLHGGPTSRTDTSLRFGIQYWTTRGFAVADVNYTGSTGYGRDYRRALYGRWGVVDVEDCLAVVRKLAREGVVDASRAAIRGGSAGGFTTLAALTHPENAFATGANYFGVADLMALARETHKFESRYLDQLVGPLPEAVEVYRDRSPITHVDRLTVPLIVLQGAEDPVVPPEQSRMIVEAVRAKGLECEYVEFEGEQHGFRRSDSIVRATEAELAFYRRVFGLGC